MRTRPRLREKSFLASVDLVAGEALDPGHREVEERTRDCKGSARRILLIKYYDSSRDSRLHSSQIVALSFSLDDTKLSNVRSNSIPPATPRRKEDPKTRLFFCFSSDLRTICSFDCVSFGTERLKSIINKTLTYNPRRQAAQEFSWVGFKKAYPAGRAQSALLVE